MQPQHLRNIHAPKVNPKVVQNQMIAYGKMKRSSMKSVNENKNGSQLSNETHAVKNGVAHDKSCDGKRN